MSSEPLQNVVVIGAASAGVQVATNLAKALPDTHRVVLIEANPVAYWNIGGLRAAVQPGFEDKVLHDLTTHTVFGPGTHHVVLAGTRVVDLKPDHVVVSRDVTALLAGSSVVEGEKCKVPLDRAVLAVGCEYEFPSRISPDAKTKEQVLDHFRQMQKEVAAAKEILVVGGGPTGVEFVGEVLDQHADKVITLLTRGPGLVTNGNDAFVGVGHKLLSQLKSKGVRVILNDTLNTQNLHTGPLESTQTFTTEQGEKIQADYVMLGLGGKPNTDWIAAIDTSIVDPTTHRIKVTPTYSLSAPAWQHYYAMGDAADTPGPKTSFVASQQAPALAHNVVCAIKGEPESKLKKAAPPMGNTLVVPLGKSAGAARIYYFTLGSWLTSLIKGKTLFLDQFHAWFNN